MYKYINDQFSQSPPHHMWEHGAETLSLRGVFSVNIAKCTQMLCTFLNLNAHFWIFIIFILFFLLSHSNYVCDSNFAVMNLVEQVQIFFLDSQVLLKVFKCCYAHPYFVCARILLCTYKSCRPRSSQFVRS